MKILEREREYFQGWLTHTPPTIHHYSETIADWFHNKERKLKKKKKSQDEEQKSENIDGET